MAAKVPSTPATIAGQVIGTEVEERYIKPAVRKQTRRASAYSKRYGQAYRQLRKKHPRMSHVQIVKKAHRLAKRS